MPNSLHRYHQTGQLHFVTFSCYRRRSYLENSTCRDLFDSALERIRARCGWAILGYVVMPEHAHMLVNEPTLTTLSRAIQALKLSVSVRRSERPFWQTRYYDFNIWSAEKVSEKLHYMHCNPVVRGLVAQPSEWTWSSYHHYETGRKGTVEIESFWTAWRREHEGTLPPEHAALAM